MSETTPAGPAAPTTGALRPLGLTAATLDPGGLLGSWQRRNTDATLPHCTEQLERSGNLDNLRRAAEGTSGEFRGMWFADSDVYKTLEAAAWELGRGPNPSLEQYQQHVDPKAASAREKLKLADQLLAR